MHRLYDFFRRHPLWVDGFWAVLLLLPSALWVLVAFTGEFPALPSDRVERTAALFVVPALCLSVALRRRMPERMLLLVVAAGLAQVVFGVPPGPANLAFFVIIFTVASRPVRWASRTALAGAVLAPVIAQLRWPGDQQFLGTVLSALFLLVTFVLAWVLGDSLRTRRAYFAQLEERTQRLEKEREAHAQIAAAAERTRIARELHDVVAHNVSVMVVQADGAAYVLDNAPEQAREALRTISGTGRQALDEMRRLLGVLRNGQGGDGDAEEQGTYVPQPGADQLAELIEQVRGAGLPVEFGTEGSVRELSSGVGLTVYRIVQEALTNSRKHGGPSATARVRLSYGGDSLTVLAEDDGRGPAPGVGDGGESTGHGLIGMRERVGMVGGTLEAGRRTGGGFRIRAVLPLKATERTPRRWTA